MSRISFVKINSFLYYINQKMECLDFSGNLMAASNKKRHEQFFNLICVKFFITQVYNVTLVLHPHPFFPRAFLPSSSTQILPPL